MKCENSSVCCNKKSNFFEPVPIVDGVAVPDSGIEGVLEPDSSGDDSEPLSDILATRQTVLTRLYSANVCRLNKLSLITNSQLIVCVNFPAL